MLQEREAANPAQTAADLAAEKQRVEQRMRLQEVEIRRLRAAMRSAAAKQNAGAAQRHGGDVSELLAAKRELEDEREAAESQAVQGAGGDRQAERCYSGRAR
eukprot:CAMPEP_0206234334 /NCGR_PEP_ID=MMETSP0047_2-20121206/12537_1 /ASSEMBLY_ACC=CAM_ASM_000192 /TAXON_ID=195065 /ORGANISM="Chroomonas mesostigmatica_cf, Strain CCMP1168" /LENGTH=101 /DNA_ID=CAMNT_0053658417 /DNA_START=237 /DNA_END=541 /DNA_ORIENTATION=+